jgi:hypothetical protein
MACNWDCGLDPLRQPFRTSEHASILNGAVHGMVSIPSTLFLTHYFPDAPQQWQEVAVASLILGQNGIWGDLLNVSDSGAAFIGSTLARYKQVRDDHQGE